MSDLLPTLASYVPDLVLQHLVNDPGSVVRPTYDRFPAAVLLADISGFTPLSESLAQQGPDGVEVLTRLLNDYFGQLVDLINEQGGDVVKFAGDGLLALWPANEPAPDSSPATGDALTLAARRAGQCALVIQKKLDNFETVEYQSLRRIRLALRVAVAAGEVISAHVGGVDGQWELLLAGRPVRQVGLAQRAAAPGDVVIDASTWALLAGHFAGRTENDDFVRLQSVTWPLAALARPAVTLTAVSEAGLRSYIPVSILSRLQAGQIGWLAELRRVTVLFVRLPGLDETTPLAEAQEITRLLQTTLHHFEGSVNKINLDERGAAVLAVLGLPPSVHEDDAVRGVLAAMEILDTLQQRRLPGAIGIATGRVFCGVVGNAARREYTVIGDVVNLAARLMQVDLGSRRQEATGVSLLCDRATAEAARSHLEFEQLPPVSLKGKARPITVYRPGRRRLPHRRADNEANRPLLGREDEMARLQNTLKNVIESGTSDLFFVQGEAGIGKTRLIKAMIQWAREQSGLQTIVGSGDAIEKNTPYFAWRTIFREIFGLTGLEAESEPVDANRQRAQIMSRLKACFEAGNSHWLALAPLLGQVLAVDWPDNELTASLSDETRAANTLNLLVHCWKKVQMSPERGYQTTLLILDDAHWLDSASWTLAEQLHRQTPALFILIASRPMESNFVDGYRQLKEQAIDRQIILERLPPKATLSLVCHRLGVTALPRPVANLILEKAEGHPFFSEELAFALRDSGQLTIEGDQCRLAVPPAALTSLTFPDTIEDVITSRIDRLSPQQQMTLKVASVIGRIFTYPLLRHIYPIPIDQAQLPEHLQALARLDITLLENPEPELTYIFKHIITQEVAYNLMLFAQRKQLHQAIALWYEQRAEIQQSQPHPLLAHHWQKAEVFDKALFYLDRAGQQALHSYANREALLFFQQAGALVERYGLVQDAVVLARRARHMAQAYYSRGNFQAAKIQFEQALNQLGKPIPATPTGMNVRLFRQLLRQLWHRLRPARLQRTTVTADERLLETIRAYGGLGEVFYFYDVPVTAVINANLSTLNLAEQAGAGGEMARAYVNWGYVIWLLPWPALARTYFNRAEKTLERLNDVATQMHANLLIGMIELGDCRWAAGWEKLSWVLAAAERTGDPQKWAESKIILEQHTYYRADFQNGHHMAGELLAVAGRRGNTLHQAWALSGLAETSLRLGRLNETTAYAQEALTLYSQQVDHISETATLGLLALAYLYQGRWEAARQAAERTAANLANVDQPTGYYYFDGYAAVAEIYLTLWERATAASTWDTAQLASAAQKACRALSSFARIFAVGRPRARLFQGWADWLVGRHSRAQRRWRQSLTLARRQEQLLDEALALFTLGRHQSGELAYNHLDQAAAICRQIGATDLLQKVNWQKANIE